MVYVYAHTHTHASTHAHTHANTQLLCFEAWADLVEALAFEKEEAAAELKRRQMDADAGRRTDELQQQLAAARREAELARSACACVHG